MDQVAGERAAAEAAADHDGEAAQAEQHGQERDPRHPLAQEEPGHGGGDQRRGGKEDQHVGGAGPLQGDQEEDRADRLQQGDPEAPTAQRAKLLQHGARKQQGTEAEHDGAAEQAAADREGEGIDLGQPNEQSVRREDQHAGGRDQDALCMIGQGHDESRLPLGGLSLRPWFPVPCQWTPGD